jgi:3-methyladenine DNA glycosylase AlkD
MEQVGPQAVAREIEKALGPLGLAERRAFLAGGYAPSRLTTVGVPVPAMRGVVRHFARELASDDPRVVIAVARALVDGGTSEGRQVGYELIARRADAMALLTPAIVRALGRGNDNWASVDGFATYVSGPAWRMGRIADADVDRWARSRNRWWRRTALASTVALNVAARGGTGDARRTLRACTPMVDERDPMLAKALSWALRSLVPHDPAAVRAFVDTYRDRLPALVRREVATKLATGRKATARRPAS